MGGGGGGEGGEKMQRQLTLACRKDDQRGIGNALAWSTGRESWLGETKLCAIQRRSIIVFTRRCTLHVQTVAISIIRVLDLPVQPVYFQTVKPCDACSDI